MFIGLNPSTADETEDDPTIRRCIRFAKDWGFGGLCMTNLFAFRATDPKVMKVTKLPVGPKNTKFLKDIGKSAGVVVFAWGIHGVYLDCDVVTAAFMKQGMCLGKTKNGQPRHPLYIKADKKLEKY